NTASRGALRIPGTVGGLVLSTVLVDVVPQSAGHGVVLLAVPARILGAVGGANCRLLHTGVTRLDVVQLPLVGVAPVDVIAARALRGSPITRADLPDLREDHHALVQSGDSLTERYALVNVETDRITNSLNTLSEDVLRWVTAAQTRAV